MAAPLAANEPPRIVVLPQRAGRAGPEITPSAAIDLALLGAAAQHDIGLDRMLEFVACLAGEACTPAREVVLDRLQRATATGWLSARESWVRSVPFVYRLTPAGASHLVALMRFPIESRDDAPAYCVASMKLALLDLLGPDDAKAVAADLRRFFRSRRDGLALRRALLPRDRPLIFEAVAEQEAQVARRLARLETMG
jgi:hypothetical protein